MASQSLWIALDHMIYINYKTKLTKPVKESFNPTNKIEIKAESDGGISHSYVQLVGGKGDASGETKPDLHGKFLMTSLLWINHLLILRMFLWFLLLL